MVLYRKGFIGGGMGMQSPRKIISFILGAIMLVLGGIPLLYKLNIIKFTIPIVTAPGFQIILWILGLAGGIFLIFDGMKEGMMGFGIQRSIMWISILVGIALLLFGGIPLLNKLGVIGFTLPVLAETLVIVLLTLAGILLLIGGFTGF
ncbi:hypothetical protein HYV81_01065 [Candidatus Woesearchaeota archaeon]|nr:hypothetical protein [Candidatus Woesearchaeota archaeon]